LASAAQLEKDVGKIDIVTSRLKAGDEVTLTRLVRQWRPK
jgi:hypothetical protein